jgi:mycoredoxin
MENPTEIIMYGTTWCGDTRRARRFLDEHNIQYKWIDIDQDPQARKFVEEVNHGFRSVPSIIFPDGSMLVEPSTIVLANKLGITVP